jgi:hypothetical protein
MPQDVFLLLSDPRAQGFLSSTAQSLKEWMPCDYDVAMMAGELAYLKCLSDGHADPRTATLTKEGKRYIRREMRRAAAPIADIRRTSVPDYGYADGRALHKMSPRGLENAGALHHGLCFCASPDGRSLFQHIKRSRLQTQTQTAWAMQMLFKKCLSE